MTTENNLEILGRTVLRERASLKMAESGMRNYSRPPEALLDLFDNAADNRIDGQSLKVQIRINKDTIVIRNEFGEGLDLVGLENFLYWGHSEKSEREIGQYGVGGKSAIGFLGTSLEIACSARDSDREYFLKDPDWRNKGEVAEKEHQVLERRAFSVDRGYFILTIGGSDKIKKPREFASRFASLLGEVYRPLLEKKQVSVTVNGEEVVPPIYKYIQEPAEFMPEVVHVENGFGHIAEVKIGVLESGQKVDPGFDVFYRGRRMRREFIGMPDQTQLPQAARVHGDIMVDHINVTTNKSDLIEDLEWDDTKSSIREGVLKKWWEEKLPNLSMEEPNKIEPYEIEIMDGIRGAIDRILPTVDSADPEWMRLASSLGIRQIGQGGQGQGGREGGERGGFGGRSSSGDTKRDVPDKRRISFDEIQPVSMHGIKDKAVVRTDQNKKILIVNTDYPQYIAYKRAGESALEHYLIDTTIRYLILESSPELPSKEFDAILNTCLGEVVKNYEESKAKQRAALTAKKKRKSSSKGSK